jgi:hypothetical protein
MSEKVVSRPHWAVCMTTTTGNRMRDHHIPELLDG